MPSQVVKFELSEQERLSAAKAERMLAKKATQKGRVGRASTAVPAVPEEGAVPAVPEEEEEEAPAAPKELSPNDECKSRAKRGTAGCFAGRRPPRSLEGQMRHNCIARLGRELGVKTGEADKFYIHMQSEVLDDLSNANAEAESFMSKIRGDEFRTPVKRKRVDDQGEVVQHHKLSPKTQHRNTFIGAKIAEGFSFKEAVKLFALEPDQVAAAAEKMTSAQQKQAAKGAKSEEAAKFKAMQQAKLARKQAKLPKSEPSSKKKADEDKLEHEGEEDKNHNSDPELDLDKEDTKDNKKNKGDKEDEEEEDDEGEEGEDQAEEDEDLRLMAAEEEEDEGEEGEDQAKALKRTRSSANLLDDASESDESSTLPLGPAPRAIAKAAPKAKAKAAPKARAAPKAKAAAKRSAL